MEKLALTMMDKTGIGFPFGPFDPADPFNDTTDC